MDWGIGRYEETAAELEPVAEVLGVDAAPRLLEVARERVPAGEFLQGTAEAIPLEEDSVDAVLSVVGVIFTPEPEAAAAEILRVLQPRGRAVITTWKPEGAIHEARSLIGEGMAEISGQESQPPFGWGDLDTARGVFSRLGAQVEIEEGALTFTGAIAEEWLAEGERSHPLMIPVKDALSLMVTVRP